MSRTEGQKSTSVSLIAIAMLHLNFSAYNPPLIQAAKAPSLHIPTTKKAIPQNGFIRLIDCKPKLKIAMIKKKYVALHH